MRARLAIASIVLLSASVRAGEPVIDGLNIPTEFPPAISTQDTNTRFGNNFNEMNQLFVTADSSNLYIGITGNLDDNNAITIFFDTVLGGANVLATDTGGPCPGDVPTLVRMLSGTTMEAAFTPDYSLLISVGIFPGQSFQEVFASDITRLSDLDNTPLGIGLSESTSGGLSGTSGVSMAINNSNTAGVGNWDDGPTPGDTGDNPASATTGIEVAIPRSLLGLTSTTPTPVGFFALLTNNAQGGGSGPCNREGYSSNQSLPGLLGADNLGPFNPDLGPQLNFTTQPGIQLVVAIIPGV